MSNKDNIRFLLDYCSKRPDLYNKIANDLCENFNIRAAEIALLVTYYVSETRIHTIKQQLNTAYGLKVQKYFDTDSCKEERRRQEVCNEKPD